jgi:hypothetical protein
MKPSPLTEFGVERHTLVRREDHTGSSSSYRIRLYQQRSPVSARAQIFQLQREVLGRVLQQLRVARPNQSGKDRFLPTHLRRSQGAPVETIIIRF